MKAKRHYELFWRNKASKPVKKTTKGDIKSVTVKNHKTPKTYCLTTKQNKSSYRVKSSWSYATIISYSELFKNIFFLKNVHNVRKL